MLHVGFRVKKRGHGSIDAVEIEMAAAMRNVRDTLHRLIQRWLAFVARQETVWRETLRSEGAEGADVEDPAPDPEAKGCGVNPEAPSLVKEVAKQKDQVRHRDLS